MASVMERKVSLIIDRLNSAQTKDEKELRKIIYDVVGEISLDKEIRSNLNLIDILIGALAHIVSVNSDSQRNIRDRMAAE